MYVKYQCVFKVSTIGNKQFIHLFKFHYKSHFFEHILLQLTGLVRSRSGIPKSPSR